MATAIANGPQVHVTPPKSFPKKLLTCLSLITVEPSMFFYTMAFMITSVIEQALFVHKACTVDHGFSQEICSNLTGNKILNKQVQKTVSTFHQWNDVAGHFVPIILAMFMGDWSDRRGRKMPMLIGLIGKLIYSCMIVVNASQPTWNLNTIIFTATLPSALLGADVAIFAACFSYISDVSSINQRTLRVTILDVIYLSTMPIGVAFGSYLFKSPIVDESYAIMFSINASLLFLAIIYSCLRLKWRTTEHQKPMPPGTNVFLDFFDKEHLVMTYETLTKPRASFGRLHIVLVLFCMMLYVFQRDENPMSYLYTHLVFDWGIAEYSMWKTFKSTFFVTAMLIGVPVLNKVAKLKDTTIVIIGATSHAAGRIFFALAKIPELFYAGAAVAALGPSVAPILRSIISKMVPAEERGKIFSMLSTADNAVPILSGFLYSQLYNRTLETLPSSIFWLTFASQIGVVLLILTIRFTTVDALSNRSESRQTSEEDIEHSET